MFTQKLSMDCTKEQYEKYLKAELEKMGYGASLARWGDDVIVNNYSSENGLVGNPSRISNKLDNSRTYLGKFNAPLFLALAAMTDNFEGGYREYYVKDDEFYSVKESGFLGANGFFRKATVSEIMAKFGEQPHNGEITFDIKSDIKELSEQIEKLAMGIQVNQYLIDIEENVHKLFKTNEMKKHTDKLIDELQQQAKAMLAALDELNEELSEKEPRFKDGDIVYQAETDLRYETLRIYKNDSQTYALYLFHNGYLSMKIETNFTDSDARVATPSEIALLDSKLAEKGKRFDKEKLELVDIPKFQVGDWFIPHKPKENKTNVFWAKEMDEFDGVALQVSEPKFKNAEGLYSEVADWHFHPDWCEKTTAPKHKEPIIGEMAIAWHNNKKTAAIGILQEVDNSEFPYFVPTLGWCANAILFESPEQYKAFINA